jgi:hypothetical protein
MLIGQGHNLVLKKIAKLEFKFLIIIIIVFSFLFNIGHLFQYALNDGTHYKYQADSYVYVYPAFPFVGESSSTFIYLIVYFIINYVIFFLLNTTVEVALVRKLHSVLKDKKRRIEDMEMRLVVESVQANPSANSVTHISFRKLRKQEMEEKSEQRAIIMVVVNAFINFFLRLPELFFLFSISNRIFGGNLLTQHIAASSALLIHVFDTYPTLKFFWTDLTYFFYILTFATNFLIYYLFNQKFKLTFSARSRAKRNHRTTVSDYSTR